jgi:hypothetical protein
VPWNDVDDIEHKLTLALQRFDWAATDEICKGLIERLPGEKAPFPEKTAKALLRVLRRKCRFDTMGLLGDAFLESGLRTPQIRRQYGQALIDQGMLSAAEPYLRELIEDSGSGSEREEAHGLMGRIYKQRYVNEAGKANRERAQRNLQRSFDEYAISYNADRKANTWHGINMVALLARAERDGITLERATDYKALAQIILSTLDEKESSAKDGLEAFDVATQMEAFVALGQFDQATGTANRYIVANGADDFEISSTLRQLLEVWKLDNSVPPGYTLLPILRAAKLEKEGGRLTISPEEAREDARKLQHSTESLEREFTPGGIKTLRWYRDGLQRATPVCRIESADYRGIGTGWLVNSADFFRDSPSRALVLTNAHVVSRTHPKALRPPDVWCNFTLLNRRIQIKGMAWSSEEDSSFDATFLDLSEPLDCVPLVLCGSALQLAVPPQRMYIIGHPGGRDIEFSLHDNELLACNSAKLHYRAPTQPGSSGSPVFDPVAWTVVGLHHSGNEKMPKLNGPAGEFYQANEGVAILAIQQKTRSLP